jgi:hypothetical protein
MADKAPGILSLVLVPALLSLLVSVLRLVGELQGWNPTLFGNVAPGQEGPQGLIGISWLIPVFGLWFGFKLRSATGQPAHAGKSALRFAIGAIVLVGGVAGLMAAGLIVMPKADAPAAPAGLGYSLALVVLAAVIMFTAWFRLALSLFVYAWLARIPVLAITWLGVENDWNTHYTRLPVGTVLPAGTSKFMFLAMPQMTFWIVTTLGLGGLCGCLGAALGRRKASG